MCLLQDQIAVMSNVQMLTINFPEEVCEHRSTRETVAHDCNLSTREAGTRRTQVQRPCLNKEFRQRKIT